jgi:UDP-N-acetylglucosamine 4,6-dehydratase
MDAHGSKRILITGGSGFLGRGLAAALRSANDVYLGSRNQRANALAEAETGCPALPLDVANIESVRDVFSEVRPQLVVHAAATKYVDLAERMPMECIDINVTGSQNVARVAVERGAEAVIAVSTDKAAPPVGNTYGLSKALMERMMCAMDAKSTTRFACVRFGNVAWSTGSVFTEWRRMQEGTGVISSTGPDMRRFFFTLDDAVELVQCAIRHVDELAGRILARPMKVAEIRDLLATWVDLYGGRWEQIGERLGDRPDETIVGGPERAFTEMVELDGVERYVISPTGRAARPIGREVSSATEARLSEREMRDLLAAGTALPL